MKQYPVWQVDVLHDDFKPDDKVVKYEDAMKRIRELASVVELSEQQADKYCRRVQALEDTLKFCKASLDEIDSPLFGLRERIDETLGGDNEDTN